MIIDFKKNNSFIINDNINNLNNEKVISVMQKYVKTENFIINIFNIKFNTKIFENEIILNGNIKQIFVLNGFILDIYVQNILVNFINKSIKNIFMIIFTNEIFKISKTLQKKCHIIENPIYKNNIDKTFFVELFNAINNRNENLTLKLLYNISNDRKIFETNILYLIELILTSTNIVFDLKNISFADKIKISVMLHKILYNIDKYNIFNENIILNLNIQLFNIIQNY